MQINNLYDNYHEFDFGYIGKDLETGEIKYFTIYGKDGKYYGRNYIREFDPNNVDSDFLSMNLYHCCNYRRVDFSEDLPIELKSISDKLAYEHFKYNVKNNLPTDILLKNKKNLSIDYENDMTLFGGNNFSGEYIPVENKINMTVTKDDWKNITQEEKRFFISVLQHEFGHMKASTYKFDENKNLVNVQTGFYRQNIDVIPIKTCEGNIFLKFGNNHREKRYDMALEKLKILEETFNDLDCIKMNPEYIGVYPKFALKLYLLSDGKLAMARYTNGVDEYYSSMMGIIDDYYKADKLLCAMASTVYGYYNKKESQKEVDSLFSEYVRAKKNKTLKFLKKY